MAYNQGSIVHLECTGAMSFDFSSMSFAKSAVGLLKHKDMMYVRKDSMERMGAAYMANGIVTLAGSRLYTSMADTPEIIDEALNRFEEVFRHVKKDQQGPAALTSKYAKSRLLLLRQEAALSFSFTCRNTPGWRGNYERHTR